MLEHTEPDELSLRAVATAAGVSRAAPYAHFQDKRALLTAVSEAGFSMLSNEMEQGIEPGDARCRFLATGRGYIRFGLNHPHLFKLMFAAPMVTSELAEGSVGNHSRAFGIFQAAFAGFLRGRADPILLTPVLETMAWSLVHGMAMLFVEKRLPDGATRESLIADVTWQFTKLLDAYASGSK
jgi:AcrR family transcriptional regulator